MNQQKNYTFPKLTNEEIKQIINKPTELESLFDAFFSIGIYERCTVIDLKKTLQKFITEMSLFDETKLPVAIEILYKYLTLQNIRIHPYYNYQFIEWLLSEIVSKISSFNNTIMKIIMNEKPNDYQLCKTIEKYLSIVVTALHKFEMLQWTTQSELIKAQLNQIDVIQLMKFIQQIEYFENDKQMQPFFMLFYYIEVDSEEMKYTVYPTIVYHLFNILKSVTSNDSVHDEFINLLIRLLTLYLKKQSTETKEIYCLKLYSQIVSREQYSLLSYYLKYIKRKQDIDWNLLTDLIIIHNRIKVDYKNADDITKLNSLFFTQIDTHCYQFNSSQIQQKNFMYIYSFFAKLYKNVLTEEHIKPFVFNKDLDLNLLKNAYSLVKFDQNNQNYSIYREHLMNLFEDMLISMPFNQFIEEYRIYFRYRRTQNHYDEFMNRLDPQKRQYVFDNYIISLNDLIDQYILSTDLQHDQAKQQLFNFFKKCRSPEDEKEIVEILDRHQLNKDQTILFFDLVSSFDTNFSIDFYQEMVDEYQNFMTNDYKIKLLIKILSFDIDEILELETIFDLIQMVTRKQFWTMIKEALHYPKRINENVIMNLQSIMIHLIENDIYCSEIETLEEALVFITMYFDHSESIFGKNYKSFKTIILLEKVSINTTIEEWRKIKQKFIDPFESKSPQQRKVNRHFPIICISDDINKTELIEDNENIKPENINFTVEPDQRLVKCVLSQFLISKEILGCLLLFPTVELDILYDQIKSPNEYSNTFFLLNNLIVGNNLVPSDLKFIDSIEEVIYMNTAQATINQLAGDNKTNSNENSMYTSSIENDDKNRMKINKQFEMFVDKNKTMMKIVPAQQKSNNYNSKSIVPKHNVNRKSYFDSIPLKPYYHSIVKDIMKNPDEYIQRGLKNKQFNIDKIEEEYEKQRKQMKQQEKGKSNLFPEFSFNKSKQNEFNDMNIQLETNKTNEIKQTIDNLTLISNNIQTKQNQFYQQDQQIQQQNELPLTLLKNKDNNCFKNSVLHALYMCTDFRNNVLEMQNTNDEKTNKVLEKLKIIFKYLQQPNNSENNQIIDYQTYTDFIEIQELNDKTQQDAYLFMTNLFDELKQHTDLITINFGFNHFIHKYCLLCKKELIDKRRCEMESILRWNNPKQMKKGVTVQQIIDDMKEIEEDEVEMNDTCLSCHQQYTKVSQKEQNKNYNKYLIININKYNFNGSITIDEQIQTNDGVQRELIGMILHKKSLFGIGGHYYTIVKTSTNEWYELNDIKQQPEKTTFEKKNKNVFILIYKAK